MKFSNLSLKICVPIIIKSLKSLKRTQLSSARDQLSTVYHVDSAQFDERFVVHENPAMRPNALLPADISDTSFDTLTEALCSVHVASPNDS